jgi:hypothetical protein
MNHIQSETLQKRPAEFLPCPVCLSTDIQSIFHIEEFPVISNLLWQRQEDARNTAKGEIQLLFCRSCGHMYNQRFNPELLTYSVKYENSLGYSAVFQKYAVDLAHYLVSQFDLNNKNLVEIGCGKGDFLKLLCEIGSNHGVGFDPSLENDEAVTNPDVRLIADIYSEKHKFLDPDFLYSRHTLEHIFEPRDLIRLIRRNIRENKQCGIFFEVPSQEYMLDNLSIWDVIYEHYSYFSRYSISRLFTQEHIVPTQISEKYNGQFLCLEASTRWKSEAKFDLEEKNVEELNKKTSTFSEASKIKIQHWHDKIDRFTKQGKKVVLWGAGSKGISFLNLLNIKDEIQYVIDLNPRKMGMFITGTGQQIVSPNQLSKIEPDTIIIMNPIYQQEIGQLVKDIGLEPEILIA